MGITIHTRSLVTIGPSTRVERAKRLCTIRSVVVAGIGNLHHSPKVLLSRWDALGLLSHLLALIR